MVKFFGLKEEIEKLAKEVHYDIKKMYARFNEFSRRREELTPDTFRRYCRDEILKTKKNYQYVSKRSENVIGVFGDTHIPFEKKGYLEFLIKTFDSAGVTEVVSVGDLIDNYVFSRFPKNPGAMNAKDEIEQAKKALKPLIEAFPVMKICKGNHDSRLEKLAESVGLPIEVLAQNHLDFPDTWVIEDEFIIDDVYYCHGTNISGINSSVNLAKDMGMSAVMGHLHMQGGVRYFKTPNKLMFGANAGALCDESAYAFHYSKDNRKKTVLGCVIVVSSTEAHFIPWNE